MRDRSMGRLMKGLGANVLNQLVTAIVQLVGVPILLKMWGAPLYGEWLILFAIPTYLSLTDLGFARSAGNDMSQQVAQGNRGDALTVFQSVAALVYCVGCAGMLLAVVLVFCLPIHSWLHFAVMTVVETRTVLILFAAQAFITLIENVNHAGFRAGGDYAWHVSFLSAVRLSQFAGVWIAALVGAGPMPAAAVFLCVQALATGFSAMFLVRRHSWLRFGIKHARVSELRRLMAPAIANASTPLAQALNVQGVVIVVGAILGPLAVVTFSTLRTMTRLSFQLVAAVSHAAEPEIAWAYGARDQALLSSLFVHTLRGATWLAVIVASTLLLFGRMILHVWVHGRVAMDPTLFHWLLASAVTSVLWYGSLTALRAANIHIRAALLYCFSSAIAICIAGVLLRTTHRLSNVGIALFTIDVAMAAYTLRAATHLVGMGVGTSLLKALDPSFYFHHLRRVRTSRDRPVRTDGPS